MGPRSVERGNRKLVPTVGGRNGLQWGRVRLNAETRGADNATALGGVCFNGAAFG